MPALPSVLVLAVIALGMLPGQAGALIDAGVAAVDIDASPAADCAADLGPLQDVCPVGWGMQGTLHPGDDRVMMSQYVDEVRVTLRPPVGEERRVTSDPRDLVVPHPAFRALNATWIQANDSLPAGAKAFVTLESRPWAGNTSRWVNVLVVHLPVAVDLTGFPVSHLYFGVCLDYAVCNFEHEYYLHADEDTIRPFPYSVALFDDVDIYLHDFLQSAERCFYGGSYLPAALCGALADLSPHFDRAYQLYTSLTPTVSVNAQYNRTTLHLDPEQPLGRSGLDAGAPGPSSAAEAGVGGSAPRSLEAPGALRAEAPAPGAGPGAGTAPPQVRPSEAGLAAVAAVVLAGPDVAPWLLGGTAVLLAAWLLYHRVAQQRALEQSTRQRVYRAICGEPGVRVGTLAARLGLAHNTVKHHVATLERFGFVLAHGDAQRRYFASQAASPEDRRLLAEVLGNPATRAVYHAVRDAGPLDLASLGARLGLAPSTVSMAVGRLRRAGLLETTRVWRRIVASPRASPGATHDASGLAAWRGR